jgi:hypothetical protein
VIAASDEYTDPIFRAPSVGCSGATDSEELEAVIACLGDDAAALRDENPESEVADNMERAAELLSRFMVATGETS